MLKPNRRLITVATTLTMAALVPLLLSAAGGTTHALDSSRNDDLKAQVEKMRTKIEEALDDNSKLADQIISLRKTHDEVLASHAKEIEALITNLKVARKETDDKTDSVKKFFIDRNLRVKFFIWREIGVTDDNGSVLTHDFGAGERIIDFDAAIIGFDHSYAPEDHDVQRLVSTAWVESIQGSVVNVRYKAWMQDGAGSRARGSVTVLVIVHLAG